MHFFISIATMCQNETLGTRDNDIRVPIYNKLFTADILARFVPVRNAVQGTLSPWSSS
jgi:hypothetical protein